jgi:hypothetical protein
LDRAQKNAGKENRRILSDAYETLKLFTTCDFDRLADREIRARRSMISDSMSSLVEAGGAGVRGMTSLLNVSCVGCTKKFPGSSGVKVLAEALQAANKAVWKALQSVGMSRDDLPAPLVPQRTEATVCAHYLGWIRIESAGVGVRGATSRVWFSCAGCKQSWNESAGVAIFFAKLREDQRKVHAAIRRLGVDVE